MISLVPRPLRSGIWHLRWGCFSLHAVITFDATYIRRQLQGQGAQISGSQVPWLDHVGSSILHAIPCPVCTILISKIELSYKLTCTQENIRDDYYYTMCGVISVEVVWLSGGLLSSLLLRWMSSPSSWPMTSDDFSFLCSDLSLLSSWVKSWVSLWPALLTRFITVYGRETVFIWCLCVYSPTSNGVPETLEVKCLSLNFILISNVR